MNTLSFEQDVEQCLEVMRNGGIILYPTDTIWGIGCDATNTEAVEKIIALKQRPENKSFVVLVADERDILKYTASPDLAVFDYLEQAKKPVTVVYEHAIGLADNVLAADGSVGIRICKDPFCKHLIRRLRLPLVSTSANISGEPSPTHFSMISEAVKKGVDYIAEHRRDDVTPANPSSVIKWKNGQVILLRS